MIRQYIALMKPGIVRGNLITAVAGFFLASQTNISVTLLLAMAVGLSAIIASACVFNNVLDRNIDAKMERTKNRALVTGAIRRHHALLFAVFLLLFGSFFLATQTTWLATILALFGVVMYVVAYGIAKRTTVHSTLIGSISGAIPPVVGYTAVSGVIDIAACLLFLILVFWQMPHFYAIAMYRAREYGAAKLPILTVKQTVTAAQRPMILYLVAYLIVSLLLAGTDLVGIVYIVLMTGVGSYWLYKSISELQTKKPIAWAKMMFGLSLIALTTQSLAIVIDVLLLAN